MPVFIKDHFRVLFVHVPKTGGTAVEFFFEKNGFAVSFVDRGGANSLVPVMKCSPQHMHAAMLREILHLRGFGYMFMTVRNPIDRLVSEYRMRAVMQSQIDDIDAWIDYVLGAYGGNNFMIDNHIRPQSEFWLPGCEVFKQEHGFGAAWVRHLRDKIACDFAHTEVEVAMRFGAVAPRRPSVASLRRIREFYAGDFELFGYDSDPAG
jgi:hypothetical protein